MLGALVGIACAEPSVSKSADPTRVLAPVPACVKNLPPLAEEKGFVRQLPEEQYWGLVVPAFEEDFAANGQTLACNGEPIFDSPNFAGATLDQAAKSEGKITYGGGANRLKIVWLRSHQVDDSTAAGPLALVRLVGNHAEVYGVGTFRGNPNKSRFDLERLGGEVVVTAVSDGCSGATPGGACDTTLTLFRPANGELTQLAHIGLERVRPTEGLEPGVTGGLTARLVTSPAYEKDGIHVVEEVSFTDTAGRVVRRGQLERAYLLDGAGVRESQESLWTRMYEARVNPTPDKNPAAGGTDAKAAPQAAPTADPKPANSTTAPAN